MPIKKPKSKKGKKQAVATTLKEFKSGELNIGKSKKKVKSRKQAVAIAMSISGQSKKKKKKK